jgi:hypothetical protein
MDIGALGHIILEYQSMQRSRAIDNSRMVITGIGWEVFDFIGSD